MGEKINMPKKPNMLFISRVPLTGFSNVNFNLYNALLNEFNVNFKHLSLNLGDKLLFRLNALKGEESISKFLFGRNISRRDYYKSALINSDYSIKIRNKKFNKLCNKLEDIDVILSTFWEPLLTSKLSIPRCIYTDDTLINFKKKLYIVEQILD